MKLIEKAIEKEGVKNGAIPLIEGSGVVALGIIIMRVHNFFILRDNFATILHR